MKVIDSILLCIGILGFVCTLSISEGMAATSSDALQADLVLLDGKIICMDQADTRAEAVSVKFGKIAAIGSNEDIKSLIGKNTQVINLGGRTVFPAFIDSHAHVFSYAPKLAHINVTESKTAEDVLKLIEEKVKQSKPGEWVQASGLGYHILAIGVEKINRQMVDEISPQNPVVINTVGHFGLLNSLALQHFNITKDTPDPKNEIWRNAQGELTGVLAEHAWSDVRDKIPSLSFEETVNALEKAIDEALKVGIGTMEDSSSYKETAQAYQRLLDEGRLHMRINVGPDIRQDTAKHYMETGFYSGFGNEWIRFGQTKIVLGTLGARTATLLEDYADKPGHRGAPLFPVETIEQFVMDSVKNGWSVHIHVMGDGDMEIALNAYEKALQWYKKETGKDNDDLRLTIDHYGGYTPEQLKRTVDMKIWASIQPIFRIQWCEAGGIFEKRLGHDRWTRCLPIGTLFKAGVPVTFGTDYPVGRTQDPRVGLYSCLDGWDLPGERITAFEAIKAYTINAARRLFRDHEIGSIEVGKLGDFTVFNLDPLELPKGRIWNISSYSPSDLHVDYTIVGGKVKYERK